MLHSLNSGLPRQPSQELWPTLDHQADVFSWGLGEDDRSPSQTLGLSHFPLVAANGVLHDLSP